MKLKMGRQLREILFLFLLLSFFPRGCEPGTRGPGPPRGQSPADVLLAPGQLCLELRLLFLQRLDPQVPGGHLLRQLGDLGVPAGSQRGRLLPQSRREHGCECAAFLWCEAPHPPPQRRSPRGMRQAGVASTLVCPQGQEVAPSPGQQTAPPTTRVSATARLTQDKHVPARCVGDGRHLAPPCAATVAAQKCKAAEQRLFRAGLTSSLIGTCGSHTERPAPARSRGRTHLAMAASLSFRASACLHSARRACSSRASHWACTSRTRASSSRSCSAWASFTEASTASLSRAVRSSSSCLEDNGAHRAHAGPAVRPGCGAPPPVLWGGGCADGRRLLCPSLPTQPGLSS